ncbi:MAG TPA: hypothetical protein VGG72_00540 [Bryobacteraceae bacterium]|jgi:hypothetical protein
MRPSALRALAVILFPTILAITGCDSVLTTAQLPSVREDGILGDWKDLGTPGSTPQVDPVLIRFKDGEYALGSPDDFAKGMASRFTLARVGNVLIAESPGEGQCDVFGTEKAESCWSLNRVEVWPDRMNWYDFDASRLGRESFGGSLNIAHSIRRQRKQDGSLETTVLLSASSTELQRFLESYVMRRGVFRLTGRLERLR